MSSEIGQSSQSSEASRDEEATEAAFKVDVAGYSSRLPLSNKVRRLVWGVAWTLLFRLSPRPCFGWRRFLLRLFGARVGRGSSIYPTTKIWGPWNLSMGDFACLGPDVDCYCMAPISIGSNATVSQYCYLCTGTHDISDPHLKLLLAPISIGEGAWVCADVFVGPGVSIGEGAVAGARASVFRDVEPWTVVGGNPARFIKRRVLEAPLLEAPLLEAPLLEAPLDPQRDPQPEPVATI